MDLGALKPGKGAGKCFVCGKPGHCWNNPKNQKGGGKGGGEGRGGGKGRDNAPRKTCHNSGKPGHTKEQCWAPGGGKASVKNGGAASSSKGD
eukprot:5667489-Pyramimonas_sp.AAC.1